MLIKTRYLLSAAIAAISCPHMAIAGDISGSVSDATETVALRAAEIRIVELGRVTSSERDGSFLFVDVPAGKYTLEVRYVGAVMQTVDIDVPATGPVHANIVMSGMRFALPDMRPAGRFRIASGKYGGTEETDGIEAKRANFGPNFRGGLFVAQDGQNSPAAQNFKIVPLAEIEKALAKK